MPDTIVTDYEIGEQFEKFSMLRHILDAMHLPKNSRIWTKLRLQNGQKFQDIARKLFSLAYLRVNEISMALAYYQEEIQEKINSCKKLEKFSTMFGIFGFWV